MKDTVRTFIAIKIFPKQNLAKLVKMLKNELSGEAIKWVEMDVLHLTLHFLGDTNPEQVNVVIQLLEEISHGFEHFEFSLKGTGYFKSNGQPSVLFIKTGNDSMLKQLAEEIEKGLISLGFAVESREFKPHLTLARIKNIKNKREFYSFVNNLSEEEIQMVPVSQIIYYKSSLQQTGPVYEPIKILKLL